MPRALSATACAAGLCDASILCEIRQPRCPRHRLKVCCTVTENSPDCSKNGGQQEGMCHLFASCEVFYVEDPDGYKIEVLQRHGRFK